MPNFLLPLRILLESYAPDSSYATYLACLPRSYSIPLFWSFEHFEMLKGSMTLASAVKDLKVFVRAYCTIYNGLAQPSKEAMPLSAEQFTWRSWKFAMGATITRQNNYTIQVEPETRVGLALIPGLDMFNHTSGSAPGADYEFGNKRAEVRSADSAKAGDEIRIVYGNRTNPKLLLYSGFIDEALPLSSIDLGVAIPTDKSSLGRSRAGLMASVGFPRDRPIALELEPPYPEASEALWVFVRLLLADEKGLDLLRDAIRHEPNLITIPGVIGEAVEKKIWDWMKVRCMVTLRGMAGTDDDVKERDALPQGSLKRAILHLRISERKFLAEAIEALGQFPEGKFAGKEHVCDGNHPQERSEHDHDHDGEPCGGHGGKGGHSHSHSHDGKR